MIQPKRTPASEMVTLLMGVRDGAAHLGAQLESIAAQSHAGWRLICSDDGSRDGSPALITRFGKAHPGRVQLVSGPQKGFAANFLHMIAALPDDPGFVGFADQDDIWEPDKIARAMHRLNTDAIPTLYSVRCWYWYPASDRRVASALATRPPGFRNALIENIATGNTIVLNPAAARLARMAAQRTGSVFAHDWWLYLLITGAGGQVFFDPGAPSLLYRQHANNAIGGGQTLAAQVARKVKVLQGAFSDRIESNLAAMNSVRDLLTAENRVLLDDFASARSAGFSRRIKALRKIAPYRQTRLGNLGFWGAASLGRI